MPMLASRHMVQGCDYLDKFLENRPEWGGKVHIVEDEALSTFKVILILEHRTEISMVDIRRDMTEGTDFQSRLKTLLQGGVKELVFGKETEILSVLAATTMEELNKRIQQAGISDDDAEKIRKSWGNLKRKETSKTPVSDSVDEMRVRLGFSEGDIFQTFDDTQPLWDDIIFALREAEEGKMAKPTYREATEEDISATAGNKACTNCQDSGDCEIESLVCAFIDTKNWHCSNHVGCG